MKPYSIDPGHPNSGRWQRAIDTAVLRGSFVCSIIESHLALKSASVLDLGCGMGGTSIAMCGRGAKVVAADRDMRRLRYVHSAMPEIHTACLDGTRLPFDECSFDVVVLQDVIEHVSDPVRLLSEAARVLRPDGLVYASSPNRWSPLNLVSDPHWGLPLLAVLRGRALRGILRVVRPRDSERDDLARLLSWNELSAIFRSARLVPVTQNRTAAVRLFTNPRELVWSGFHIGLVRIANSLRISRPVVRHSAIADGALGKRLVPAWYIIARREET
jgi:SAM-dependent methyltransferase